MIKIWKEGKCVNIKKSFGSLTRNVYLLDFFIMSFFCVVLAVFHSTAAARLIFACICLSMLLEFVLNAILCNKVLKKKSAVDLPMSAYMGLCTALMMPSDSPVFIASLALLFAYSVVYIAVPLLSKSVMKSSRLQLMPAALAATFMTVFFKGRFFTYTMPAPSGAGNVNGTPEILGEGAESLAKMLSDGSVTNGIPYSFSEILFGYLPGAMGSVLIILAACCVFIIVKRPSFALAPLGFIAVVIIWALLFPRFEPLAEGGAHRGLSVLLELSSGSLLFAAFFLLALPKYLPKNFALRIAYGALCGALTMLLRLIGYYEETVCIAILLMNFTLPLFNGRLDPDRKKSDKKLENTRKVVNSKPDFLGKKPSEEDIFSRFSQ